MFSSQQLDGSVGADVEDFHVEGMVAVHETASDGREDPRYLLIYCTQVMK